MTTKKTNKQKPKKESQLKNAIQLSGIGIQMGVIIYLFVLLGKWLDTNYNNGDKLFIIITTLLGVAVSLYVVLKQLNRIKY